MNLCLKLHKHGKSLKLLHFSKPLSVRTLLRAVGITIVGVGVTAIVDAASVDVGGMSAPAVENLTVDV